MTARRLLLVLALAGCSSGGATADSARARARTSDTTLAAAVADTVTATAATAVSAGASGGIALPFRARGNEPGWSLDVRAREMTLVADYGERRVVAATPSPTRSGDTTRWAARAQGHEVLVTVIDRLCHDAMSGFAFPRTVAVRLDGRELSGCGGESVEVLLGPAWTVRGLGEATAPKESPSTVRFMPHGHVVGGTGCNQFGARYTLRGEELVLSDLTTTTMGCAPAVMDRERRFLALLASVRRFERAGDSLILRTEEGQEITARR